MRELNSYQYNNLMQMAYTLDDDFKHNLEQEYADTYPSRESSQVNEVKRRKNKGGRNVKVCSDR
jgi:hypothetical protein